MARNNRALGLLPSQLYLESVGRLAHEHDLHVYLLCVRPRVDVSLAQECAFSGGRRVTLTRHAVDDLPPLSRTLFLGDGDSAWGDLNDCYSEGGSLFLGDGSRLRGGEVCAWLIRELLQGDRDERDFAYEMMEEFQSLSVVYVGKSYGLDGSRTAVDRLSQGHEKLTRVLSEVNDYSPSVEAYVLLMDCHADFAQMWAEISRENVADVAKAAVALQSGASVADGEDVVDVIEGSLIRLFQPEFNERLLTFPSVQTSEVPRRLRDAGFTGVGVQITLSGTGTCLWMPNGERRIGVQAFFDFETGGLFDPRDPLSSLVYTEAEGLGSHIRRVDLEMERLWGRSRR